MRFLPLNVQPTCPPQNKKVREHSDPEQALCEAVMSIFQINVQDRFLQLSVQRMCLLQSKEVGE